MSGLFALAGIVLGQYFENKRNQEREELSRVEWIRDNAFPVYKSLNMYLENIVIPIQAISSDANKYCLDIERLTKDYEAISKYIDMEYGNIMLFCSPEIKSKLFYMRANLYEIVSSEINLEVDIAHMKDSLIYKSVMEAKTICSLISDELGISKYYSKK